MPVNLRGGGPERAEEEAGSSSNSFSANPYGMKKCYSPRVRVSRRRLNESGSEELNGRKNGSRMDAPPHLPPKTLWSQVTNAL